MAEGAGKNSRCLQHQLRCFLIQLLSWMCPGVQTLLEGHEAQAQHTVMLKWKHPLLGMRTLRWGQFSSVWRCPQLPWKTSSPTSWQKGCQGPTAATRPRSRQRLLTENTLCQNLVILLKRSSEKFLRWQEGHLPDILL